MGLFSLLGAAAPFAGMAVGGPAGLALGAAGGALAARERNQELAEKQKQSAQAAADAIRVSWAAKDGKGSIPQVQYNQESPSGNLFGGALGGGMQAYALGGKGMLKSKPTLMGPPVELAGSAPVEPPKSIFSRFGNYPTSY